MENTPMPKTLLSCFMYFLLFKGISAATVYLTATETPQYFTSPNYPSNYPSYVYDTIRISSFRADWKVAIEFTSFRIESSSSCSFDKLKLYDGEPFFSKLEGTFCGYDTPDELFSSSNKASIVFQSDSSGQYRGFRFKYFASENFPFDSSIFTSAIILYICLGVFIPIGIIVFLIVVVFVCAHAGKSKRTRVADMRLGQQNMRANMINTHHVQGGHAFPVQGGPAFPVQGGPVNMINTHQVQGGHVFPVQSISGATAPVQQQPMYAPPPYDAADYSTSAVPPPFNYLDPDSNHDKNQRLFAF